MANKRVFIVGAAGDVGQGIVAASLARGWSVVAGGRDTSRLAKFRGSGVTTVAGDLGSEASAAALWERAVAAFGGIDAVVVSVNAPIVGGPLIESDTGELAELFAANVLTHFNAAKAFLPLLPADWMLLGIGGGTADFIIPKMVHISVAQAGLRMLYRGLSHENRQAAAIRELIIVSMVAGESNRNQADPSWLTDSEIGTHVCTVLAHPAWFPGPILSLKSKDQVGQPDAAPARTG